MEDVVKQILDNNKGNKPLTVGQFKKADRNRIVSSHYMGNITSCLLECAPDRMLEVSLPPRSLSYDLNRKLIKQYVESKGYIPSLADFNRDGMGHLIRKYGGSHVAAIMDAFPGKYERWEIGRVPSGYWSNKENVLRARVWLKNKIGREPLYTDYADYGISAAYRRIH